MGHSDELGARVQLRPGGRHDFLRSRLLCVIIRLLFWATALHAAPHRVINAPCSAPALTGLGTGRTSKLSTEYTCQRLRVSCPKTLRPSVYLATGENVQRVRVFRQRSHASPAFANGLCGDRQRESTHREPEEEAAGAEQSHGSVTAHLPSLYCCEDAAALPALSLYSFPCQLS